MWRDWRRQRGPIICTPQLWSTIEKEIFPHSTSRTTCATSCNDSKMTTFYSSFLICVANKNHFSSAKGGLRSTLDPFLLRSQAALVFSEPHLVLLRATRHGCQVCRRQQTVWTEPSGCCPPADRRWARNAERSKALLELDHTLSKNPSWFERDQHEEVLVDRC